MNTLQDLMGRLGIERYPARWTELYDDAMAAYARDGCEIIEEDYLLRVNAEFPLFTTRLDDVLRAAAQLRKNEDLKKLLTLLNLSMRDRTRIKADIGALDPPKPPNGADPLPYDMLGLFVLPPTAAATAQHLRERGVPEDIIMATMRYHEGNIHRFELLHGRPGLRYVHLAFGQLAVDGRLLRIGRFNFERKRLGKGIRVFRSRAGAYRTLADGIQLHRTGMALGSAGYTDADGAYDGVVTETEAYCEGYPIDGATGRAARETVRLLKRDWEVSLREGDDVIGVHIPPFDSFTPDVCERSYARAAEVFAKSFPEYDFKAFQCASWLMDPQLEVLLKPGSNIAAFQKRYQRYPLRSDGRGVFGFVFQKPFRDYAELPETTSLERALKTHYMSGKYIYELAGWFIL